MSGYNNKAQSNKIEVERTQFNKFLIDNPNYFGNLDESNLKPVRKIIKNTSYEKLTCVGLKFSNTLEATIAILRPFGYGGNLCSGGSTEYVRFFIKYAGTGWVDVGLTAVNVHDIPNKKDCAGHEEKPLTYVVNYQFDPKRKSCKYPVIPKVRAILSWNTKPPAGDANFNWKPVYGDVMDCFVQISPSLIYFSDVMADLSQLSNVKIPEEYQSIDVGPLPPLPHLPLAKLSNYEKAEPIRLALTDIHAMLTSGTASQNFIATKKEEYKSLGIDLAKSADILVNTKADVTFEELECLGLDYNQEKLVATVRIKKPTGYYGSLCYPGGIEYIAFWADRDNTCKWTFLDIGKINVHSFGDEFPTGGICYSIELPIDLSKFREHCEIPKTVRVRAVLSFNIPPSSTDPNDLKYYGNRLDSHVQIKPIETGLIFNNVSVADIDAVTGLTTADAKWTFGGDVDHLGRACPFGGLITIRSKEIFDTGKDNYYKVEVENPVGAPAITLTQSPEILVVEGLSGVEFAPTYSGNGYYKILPTNQNIEYVLHRWQSSGEELCKIRVIVREGPSDSANKLDEEEHLIQLHNTPPLTPAEAGAGWDTLRDRLEVKIISAGAVANCMKFSTPAIEGIFFARDKYIGNFYLRATPANIDGVDSNKVKNEVCAASEICYAETGPLGNKWNLDLETPNKMKKCGYNISLRVQDRTLYGRKAGYPIVPLWKETQVGFCYE